MALAVHERDAGVGLALVRLSGEIFRHLAQFLAQVLHNQALAVLGTEFHAVIGDQFHFLRLAALVLVAEVLYLGAFRLQPGVRHDDVDLGGKGILQERVDVVGGLVRSLDIGSCALVGLVHAVILVHALVTVVRDGGILDIGDFLERELGIDAVSAASEEPAPVGDEAEVGVGDDLGGHILTQGGQSAMLILQCL